MERQGLEPGLLSIFRVYVVLRLIAMLAVVEFFFPRYGPWSELLQVPYIVLFWANFIFMLVYLSWPWLQDKLGHLYLPIALVVASIGPILEGRYLLAVYEPAYEARFWLVFPFLAIPLILTAWQYRFRYVVAFCFGTALLEAILIVILPAPDAMQAMSDMGYVVVRTVFFILMGYIVSHLMTEQRERRQDLAEANRKLMRYATTLEQLAVSQERNRLARELHDTLAHTLSALAVQLDALATVWHPIPPKARTMLERALAITRTGLDDTRRVLQALRATPIEDKGLALALRRMAEDAAARGRLSLRLDIADDLGDLSPEVEQCYYRVGQEAIENVLKHAAASSLSVSLGQNQGRLLLKVSDDGRGFSIENLADPDLTTQALDGQSLAPAGWQFGIRGMQERAELIGGVLQVESVVGQGTTIRLSSDSRRTQDVRGENP